MIDIRGICGRPHGSRNGALNTDTDHSHFAEAGHCPDECPPGGERGGATGMNIAERLVSFLLSLLPTHTPVSIGPRVLRLARIAVRWESSIASGMLSTMNALFPSGCCGGAFSWL